ncbi:hypothetical protein VTO42DRAFT_5780 [Malbranchea cinnamomea]
MPLREASETSKRRLFYLLISCFAGICITLVRPIPSKFQSHCHVQTFFFFSRSTQQTRFSATRLARNRIRNCSK